MTGVFGPRCSRSHRIENAAQRTLNPRADSSYLSRFPFGLPTLDRRQKPPRIGRAPVPKPPPCSNTMSGINQSISSEIAASTVKSSKHSKAAMPFGPAPAWNPIFRRRGPVADYHAVVFPVLRIAPLEVPHSRDPIRRDISGNGKSDVNIQLLIRSA